MSSSGAKRQRTETGQKKISVGKVLNDLDKKVNNIKNSLPKLIKKNAEELEQMKKDYHFTNDIIANTLDIRLHPNHERFSHRLDKIEQDIKDLKEEGYETETQEPPPRTGNTSSSDESSDEDSDEENPNTFLPPSTLMNSLKY